MHWFVQIGDELVLVVAAARNADNVQLELAALPGMPDDKAVYIDQIAQTAEAVHQLAADLEAVKRCKPRQTQTCLVYWYKKDCL